MKKSYSLFICFSFASILSVQSQNIETNQAVLGNTDQQNNLNNVQINASLNNANMQDIALNNNENNPPSNIINTNIAVQQQTQIQVQTNTTNQNITSVSLGSSSRSSRTSYSASSSFSSSGSHAFKMKLHIGKVHIARKFFHECPLFQSKTYKHLFRGKNKSYKKCFHF